MEIRLWRETERAHVLPPEGQAFCWKDSRENALCAHSPFAQTRFSAQLGSELFACFSLFVPPSWVLHSWLSVRWPVNLPALHAGFSPLHVFIRVTSVLPGGVLPLPRSPSQVPVPSLSLSSVVRLPVSNAFRFF